MVVKDFSLHVQCLYLLLYVFAFSFPRSSYTNEYIMRTALSYAYIFTHFCYLLVELYAKGSLRVHIWDTGWIRAAQALHGRKTRAS